MRKADILIPIKAAAYGELSEEHRLLIDAARRAATRAYAPYSHFSVGAAIRLDDGMVVEGSNQENAAFPSGLCAERTAAFYAHSRFPERKFRAIAIAAIGADGHEVNSPIAPCGACRQVLVEYEKLAGAPVEVILASADEVFIIGSVSQLLPVTFDSF